MKLFNKINKRGSFDETNSLRTQLTVTRMYGFVMTVFCCLLGIGFMMQNNNFAEEKAEMVSSYEAISEDYNILENTNNYLQTHYESMSETITELVSASQELEEQNRSLVASNQEYYEELELFKTRSELYDRYDYALVDECGKRTDITYDQLVTLQDLVADSNIKDEDLYLAWIMTESGGDEKAKSSSSTAKGYGQILDGTSKFVYTDLLNKSGWSSSVALDGDTNMEMMVALVDYLYEKNDGNLYAAMRNYRGKQDISGYVNKIDSYLAEAGKSVSQISLACRSSYE